MPGHVSGTTEITDRASVGDGAVQPGAVIENGGGRVLATGPVDGQAAA